MLCINLLHSEPTSLACHYVHKNAAAAVSMHEVDMLGFDFQKPEERTDQGLNTFKRFIPSSTDCSVCGRCLDKFRVCVCVRHKEE